MFEQFTAQAREVITVAADYARSGGHAAVEPVDLALALHSVGPSVASAVLDAVSTLDERREAAKMVAAEPGLIQPHGSIPFTPNVKRALELSQREALSLGHNHIGPEHMLLALVRVSSEVVEGVTLDAVVKELNRQPAPAHTVAWTPAMEKTCSEWLEACEEVTTLLERPAIPVSSLRAAVSDATFATGQFEKALDALVLPRRSSG